MTPETITPLPDNGDLIDLYLLHLTGTSSPNTVRTYATALRRAHHHLGDLPEASDVDIEAWIFGHQAASTRSVYRAAIREFFSWAVRAGHLSLNTADALPRVRRGRRLPRPTTDEQTRLILTEAVEPIRTWSKIAAYAGARCCEIARLAREDMTQDTTLLDGKGDNERLVPTHEVLWELARDLPPGLIAGGATSRDISRWCNREYRRLGLHPHAGRCRCAVCVTAHRLRHWAGTKWLAAIGDLRAVQELMGHASPSTTAGYTMASPTAMRAAIAAAPVW